MTDNTEPTLEDLQAQILELKKQTESDATRINELESSNAKLNEDLGNARSLNAKLMKTLPAGGETDKEPENHKETPDEFFDSFIEPAVKNLGLR